MFEECDSLPTLLVAVAVGDHSRLRSLLLYARLNKRFAAEVRNGVLQWCAGYERLKTSWLEAYECEDFSTREIFRCISKMKRTINMAFGRGFYEAYGAIAYASSMYTPQTYLAMSRRRCVICSCPMSTSEPRLQMTAKTFCFAHHDCIRPFCVMKTGAEIVQNQKVTRISDVDVAGSPIRQGWHDNTPFDRVVALMWYIKDSPTDAAQLFARCSPLFRSINSVYKLDLELPMVVWIAPRPGIVRMEDTLLGALGGSLEDMAECFAKARERRAVLVEERNERVREIRRTREEAAAGRRADLRLAMGSSSMHWRTPDDVTDFHPNVGRISYMDAYLLPCRNPQVPLQTVMQRLSFLDRVLCDQSLSRATIDFFLEDSDHLEGRMPAYVYQDEASRLPWIAREIDRFESPCFVVKKVEVKLDGNLKVTAETQWPSGKACASYDLLMGDVWMAGVHLEEVGVNVDDFDVDDFDSKSIRISDEIITRLTNIVRLALCYQSTRRDAYELMGLPAVLGQLHQHPPADVPYYGNGDEHADIMDTDSFIGTGSSDEDILPPLVGAGGSS